MKTKTEVFDVMVDGKAVTVKATPYQINTGETRFRVSINESPIHIFAWDDNRQRLADIASGNAANKIPAQVEAAISEQINSRLAA
ncbi:MAG: hypothetical protein QM731_16075 [Chitinophagaceae bacterium]